MTLVPFGGRYLDAVVDLLHRRLTADAMTRSLFVRKVLLDPNFLPDGAPVALDEAGAVVGFALAIRRCVPIEEMPLDPTVGYITLLAADSRETSAALLAHAEEFLAGHGCKRISVSAYSPNYFTPGVDVAAYPETLATYLAAGYREVYRPISMDCNLLKVVEPAWVREKAVALADAGVTVAPYRADLIPELMAFVQAEFAGDWQRYAREAVARIEMDDPPTRVWIAHEGGTVLGFSHHEGERFGPIGVATSQRGRGIGQVLLYRTLDAMRAQGLHNAWFMWSDDRTAARLYSEAGFVESRRFAVLTRDLA